MYSNQDFTMLQFLLQALTCGTSSGRHNLSSHAAQWGIQTNKRVYSLVSAMSKEAHGVQKQKWEKGISRKDEKRIAKYQNLSGIFAF